MPLLGNERLDGREVVEAYQHLAVRAVGTAVALLHALCDDDAVGVTFFASPPYGAVLARSHIAWIKNRISVFKSLAYVPIETSFKLGSSLSEI